MSAEADRKRKSREVAEDISAAIMAGGRSTRMGTDKGLVLFQGKPMIGHVIERVMNVTDRIAIVTNDPGSYSHFGYPTIQDIYQGMGPLGGIQAALNHLVEAYLLVVACDMPWLQISLLEHMISLRTEGDVIVPRWTKFPEPLHAIYSKKCLGPVTESLELDIRKVVGFYGKVSVRYVDREEIQQFDPHGRSFANINTPDDIEQAESW